MENCKEWEHLDLSFDYYAKVGGLFKGFGFFCIIVILNPAIFTPRDC